MSSVSNYYQSTLCPNKRQLYHGVYEQSKVIKSNKKEAQYKVKSRHIKFLNEYIKEKERKKEMWFALLRKSLFIFLIDNKVQTSELVT